MLRPLAPLLKLAAATFLSLALIDLALFRSGVYARVIKPESTAGAIVDAALAIKRYRDPQRQNVLVLGNSQVAEGLSGQIADAASGDPSLHFVNGAAAGTMPRVWNYLLRQVDPEANRFRAIVMMVGYDETYNSNDMANYPLDVSYAAPLLRLGDLYDFPASFTNSDLRTRATRAILLPMQALHEDVQDLLAHPLERYDRVHRVRRIWLRVLGSYGGQGEALPQLAIDDATGQPVSWGSDEATWKPKLAGYFRDMRKQAPADLQAANSAYQRYWIDRIASRYRSHGAKVIVFNMARGPWKAQLLPAPVLDRTLAEMRDAGEILALPGDAFTTLEKPEYFFDTLHLNSAGRERFSKLFAAQVAPLVH
jgi:hypothetical protein